MFPALQRGSSSREGSRAEGESILFSQARRRSGLIGVSSTSLAALGWAFGLCGCEQPRPVEPVRSIAGLITSDWPSPIVQLDAPLVPSDPLLSGRFGTRIAISDNRLVATAPSTYFDSVYSVGGAYVFERDAVSGAWTELTKLVPDGASNQETFSAAIDGDTVVLGTPYRTIGGGWQEGALYIFERDQGGAGQWGEVKRISGVALGEFSQFGASLVLRDDLLIVGALDPDDVGYVQMFERNRGGPGAWGLVTNVGYQDGGLGPELFGVSIELDGDLLLVGATKADVSDYASNDGAAYLFQRDPINRDAWSFVKRFTLPEAVRCTGGLTISEMWTQSVEAQQAWQDCAAADLSTHDAAFGGNFSVSGDTVVIGHGGLVYVFRRDPLDSSLWPQVALLENDDSVGYGRLLLKGDRLYAGSSGAEVDSMPARGAVHVLDRDPNTGEFNRIETLIASDGLGGDYFGNSIAVDDTNLAIAAYARGGYRGAVYVRQIDAAPQLPDPPGCQPRRPPTDTLEPRGSVADPSGLVLAAPRAALAARMPVWIEVVPAPAEPLPLAAAVSGDYFEVGAECAALAPSGNAFNVTLPVPPTADPARLSAAVLVPASALQDSTSTGRVWLPLPGRYDGTRSVYSVRVAGLSPEGVTFVLYEDPNLISSPPQPARTGAPFWVSCFGLSAQDCAPQLQDDVRDALVEALQIFELQRFPAPHLVKVPVPASSGAIEAYPAYLTAGTDPACTSAEGVRSAAFFDQLTGSIHMCVYPADPALAPDALRRLMRHELFHAIQFAFPLILDDPGAARWVIEGTADAAAGWDGSVMRRRPNRDFRKVDSSLADDGLTTDTTWLPYNAQDFWVHLFRSTGADGTRRNIPLGELNSFFELGATTQSVADRLAGSAGPSFRSLADEYWAWAKNQAFEHTDVDFDGVLTNPCALGSEAGIVNYHVYSAGAEANEDELFVGLNAGLLTKTTVVQFPSGLINAIIEVEAPPGIQYKIYLENDPSVADCRGGVSDGDRMFAELLPNASVVVLIANTAHSDAVPPPVKLTIRTP